MSATMATVLGIVRNPYGYTDDQVRAARLALADAYEREVAEVGKLRGAAGSDAVGELPPLIAELLADLKVQYGMVGTRDVDVAAWNAKLDRAIAALSQAPRPESPAARDVLAERRRQVEVEGWTPEHDDSHWRGELARAAACYAVACRDLEWPGGQEDRVWGWDAEWWKPGSARRNLIKAGALILAEIERLDRAALQSLPAGPRDSLGDSAEGNTTALQRPAGGDDATRWVRVEGSRLVACDISDPGAVRGWIAGDDEQRAKQDDPTNPGSGA